jgi:hypothetical protein
VSRYLDDVHHKAPASALYVVFIGGNDLRDALEALATDPTGATSSTSSCRRSAPSSRASSIYTGLARTFLVANAPNIALVPAGEWVGDPQISGTLRSSRPSSTAGSS